MARGGGRPRDGRRSKGNLPSPQGFPALREDGMLPLGRAVPTDVWNEVKSGERKSDATPGQCCVSRWSTLTTSLGFSERGLFPSVGLRLAKKSGCGCPVLSLCEGPDCWSSTHWISRGGAIACAEAHATDCKASGNSFFQTPHRPREDAGLTPSAGSPCRSHGSRRSRTGCRSSPPSRRRPSRRPWC